ncbi:spondin domain-containing protein [Candidatus Albibeggiatoa sp. nov. NOAA]|uniref:spondin domain-containing protein n=1 Tax=Candidatus Albibeggiatoa sp. nov. NOAA TaxID=3162724 RepID=UPI0032F9FF3D|nr:spondin domain-containing protein [Thiotrichaceae bacterium]
MNTLRTATYSSLLAFGLIAAPLTYAQTARYEISVTNLTANQPLSPLAIVLHGEGYHTMEIGQPATLGLERLAEGGDANAFLAEATGDHIYHTHAGEAPIAPGGTASMVLEFDADDKHTRAHHGDDGHKVYPYLSVTTMLVNTNDAFTSLNAKSLAGLEVGDSMTMRTIAYDAGTELNTEAQGTIPGPADGGEGFNAERNDLSDMVTAHTGVVTRDDGLATSVLDQSHRFLNPVTMIKITRLEDMDKGEPEDTGTKVKFTDVQSHYKAGDRFLVEVEEPTTVREQMTDLWAALRMPDGTLLFATTSGDLSTTQQPFKLEVSPEQRQHTVFDAVLPEGLDGDYMLLTFYAQYIDDVWTLHSNIMQHPFTVGE